MTPPNAPAAAIVPDSVRETILSTFGQEHLGCHAVSAHDAWYMIRALGWPVPKSLAAAARSGNWK